MDETKTLEVLKGEPTGIEALRQAIDFVSKGVPMSEQMIAGLTRMLGDHQERIDLVQTVMTHFEMGRLLTMLQGMQLVERKAFSESKMSTYTNRELIELLKLLQNESRSIMKYIDEKASKPLKTSETEVKDVADPAKLKARAEAAEALEGVAPGSRRRIAAFVEQLQKEANKTIEMTTNTEPAQPPASQK